MPVARMPRFVSTNSHIRKMTDLTLKQINACELIPRARASAHDAAARSLNKAALTNGYYNDTVCPAFKPVWNTIFKPVAGIVNSNMLPTPLAMRTALDELTRDRLALLLPTDEQIAEVTEFRKQAALNSRGNMPPPTEQVIYVKDIAGALRLTLGAGNHLGVLLYNLDELLPERIRSVNMVFGNRLDMYDRLHPVELSTALRQQDVRLVNLVVQDDGRVMRKLSGNTHRTQWF